MCLSPWAARMLRGLCICFLTYSVAGHGHDANGRLEPNSKLPCRYRDPLMIPTHDVHWGQDVIWQIPNNPKAILFVAHGRGESAWGLFDPGPRCQQCTGLPEKRIVTLDALKRRYAVVALKSIGENWDWEAAEASQDLMIATTFLAKWMAEHSLQNLPLVVWGTSAGGLIVNYISLVVPVRALVLMISAGVEEVMKRARSDTFPPTYYIHMPKDESNLDAISESMANLMERGVPVVESRCFEKPVDPLFFSERIRCMSNETSEQVYRAYRAEGWLDAENYLIRSPNHGDDWRSVLWRQNALPYCKEEQDLCLIIDVWEELLMAYAMHGWTSEANEEVFAWLDSRVTSANHSTTFRFASWTS